MPLSYQGARAPEGSTSGPDTCRSAPKAPQSTHSPHRSGASPAKDADPEPRQPPPDDLGSADPGYADLGSTWLSLDALEPFPGDLWRLPIANEIFDRRAELSEAAFRTALAFCLVAARFVPSSSNGEAKETGKAVESGHWTCPDRAFKRKTLQAASGLSDTATRTALKELTALGWVAVDKSGMAYRYRWTREVPTERFTQVPTVLLEKLPALPCGTAFDVFWAVLRGTWGWTQPTPPDHDEDRVGPRMHRRWAQLSVKALAAKTGRSVKSVKQAIKRLNGQWIERVRPSTGAAQFRVLPEALMQLAEGSPLSGETANELPAARQRTSPPFKELTSSKRKDKQARPASSESKSNAALQQPPETSAVRANHDSRRAQGPKPPPDNGTRRSEESLRAHLPDEKQAPYNHLTRLGMWPGRAFRVCRRYSLARLRRNVGYFQHQTRQQPIQNPGAWLYHAITDDFAFEKTPAGSAAPLPTLKRKKRYTPDQMQALVQSGIPAEHFHRAAGDPETPWMYLGEGGPGRGVGTRSR